MASSPDFVVWRAWRAHVAELAMQLYGRTIEALEDELIAGYEVGETPAEFVAGAFSSE